MLDSVGTSFVFADLSTNKTVNGPEISSTDDTRVPGVRFSISATHPA